MDAEQLRIQADLRGLLDGDVHCDPLSAQMYASDASIYEVRPLGVIYPRHRQDVVKVVEYAIEHSIPIFPRGAGSGVAGQSLGPGLVLDFTVYMRRVGTPDLETKTIRVQPGVSIAELNRSVEKHGLLFGPDPATRSVSTIGSAIAVNTSGSHWPVYGSASDSVEGLEVVLADGQLVDLAKHPWRSPSLPGNVAGQLACEIGQFLHSHSQLIEQHSPRGLLHTCGYRIGEVLSDDYVDLARLQANAEGTLSVITEAKLRLFPMAPCRGVVLLFFDRLETAATAALEARRDRVAACDLMDRRLLEIARETDRSYASLLPRGSEAMLLIEHQGENPIEVRKRLVSLANRIARKAPKTISSRITTDKQERDLCWRLPRRVVARLYRLKGMSRPLPFIDDISIPPERLPEFITALQGILQSRQIVATIFAHAAHGQIQVRPFMNLADEKDIAALQDIAEAVFELVLQTGGIVSGENAIGLSRSWFARRQMGELYNVARRVKEIFDPNGLLNPGKLITDAPQRVHDNLRPIPASDQHSDQEYGGAFTTRRVDQAVQKDKAVASPLGLGRQISGSAQLVGKTTATASQQVDAEQNLEDRGGEPFQGNEVESTSSKFLPILDWEQESSLALTTRSCNGCGRCRTDSRNERMCPMYRALRREDASPRSKANLLRGVLTGNLDLNVLETEPAKQVADLCFQCQQCRVECPAEVDIPKLVTEMKAQYVASHGLRMSDVLLSRLDVLASLASRFPNLANWALGNEHMRWLLEKATGIAQSRRLPRIDKQSFLRWAARRRLNRPKRSGGRKVLFFVDQYVNWHNPLLGRALVEVLQHHKIEVYIPASQTLSWISKIAMGDIHRAKKLMRSNVRLLSEAVHQGYTILSVEPSATLALTREYINLDDCEETRLIAENTQDACSYLWNLHQTNDLELDFRPVPQNILYHQPCHLKVLDPQMSGYRLLRMIPGLSVEFADQGCSGMAGTFGMKRANFRTSIRIGLPLMNRMEDSSIRLGATECTACKLQMEQRTVKPTLHPVALMAYAYGLLPEVAEWMQHRNEGLLVR